MFDLLIVLIVGLPLVGFVVTALIGRRLDKEAHWIPVGLIVLVWAISMVVAFATLTHAEPFGEAGHGTSLFTWIPAGDFQEGCQDRFDIFWSFAERRDAQLVDVQPIIEVQAESPGFDLSRQILVRSCNHANVYTDGARVAQRIELVIFYDA